jgi:hypothetical protein
MILKHKFRDDANWLNHWLVGASFRVITGLGPLSTTMQFATGKVVDADLRRHDGVGTVDGSKGRPVGIRANVYVSRQPGDCRHASHGPMNMR